VEFFVHLLQLRATLNQFHLSFAKKDMKNIYSFTLFFLVATIASCSKENILTLDKSIVGKWQFLDSIGGLTGNDTIKPPANTTIILALNSDKTYNRTVNGQIIVQGTYDIINVQSIFSASPQPAIRFDNLTSNDGLIINLHEPNLSLDENHVEPFEQFYKRVQ
jgi:hypothetical protein